MSSITKEKKRVALRPTSIGVLLQNLVARSSFSQVEKLQKLTQTFPKVFGEQVASQMIPTDLRKGVLFLKVSSSVWKQELFLQKKTIIAKCNQILESPVIYDIRFI